MRVTRIVATLAMPDPHAARRFYVEALGLDPLMDHGWIVTFGSRATMPVQISVAREGGSGQPVPDLSVEVDDLAEALRRLDACGFPPVYGPCDEPWGVRRFFVRDPAGRLVNVLTHSAPDGATRTG